MAFLAFEQWQIHDTAGHRKYINADERKRFLAQAERLPPDLRALCYLLVLSGARISELLSLSIAQLDRVADTVTVRTLKRRKIVFRVIPIPTEMTNMLVALPVHASGRIWMIHRTTAWRTVKRMMERAGITGPMACNRGLRHGFGIRAAGCNVPPNVIQKWMGHASLHTTVIYVDAVGSEERSFAERMW